MYNIDSSLTKITDTLDNQILIHYINDKSKILGVSLDVLVTIGITLFIFIFGQYLIRRNERKKTDDYLKDIYDYFIDNIRKVMKNFENELNVINDSINYFNNYETDARYFLLSSLISFDVFTNIPRNDLYKSFIKYHTGDKETNKSKFLSISNSINNISIRLIDFRKIIENFDNIYVEEIKKHNDYLEYLKSFKLDLNEKIFQKKANKIEIELSNDINILFANYAKNVKNMCAYNFNKTINLELINILDSKYKEYNGINELRKITSDMRMRINYFISLKDSIKNSLKVNILSSVTQNKDILENSLI